MSRNVEQDPEETECALCKTIPVSHLSLDLPEPVTGWERALAERGVEVVLDTLGRPAVRREALAELLAESREREARLAAQRAEQATAPRAPVPAGIPALADDASPFESLAAGPGYVTPQQEFGRPKPTFLDEELEQGRRREADRRAEAEAVKRAQRVLDGRDK